MKAMAEMTEMQEVKEMRKFRVVVDGDKVGCTPGELHVAPKYKDKFLVSLDPKAAKDYELKVHIEPGAKFPLTKEKEKPTSVELVDDCGTRGKAKFTIELIPKGNAKPLTPLDPIVVND